MLAERRVRWFAALEAATASITAGWLLHGQPLPAAVNGTALVGFAIASVITGHRAGPHSTLGAAGCTRDTDRFKASGGGQAHGKQRHVSVAAQPATVGRDQR